MMMFTDFKHLFDAITKGLETTEKRLMIEAMATRKSYDRNEISNVWLVPRTSNPADGLTKPTKYNSIYNILVKGKYYIPGMKWINRLSSIKSCTTT